jgi:hypothetical protein
VKKRFILILSFFIQAAIIFEAGAADSVIKGSGATSATAGLNAADYTDKSLLYTRNDGKVGINNTNPGSALDVKGTLRLSGATSGYVGLTSAAIAGSTTYTLPSSDGASGQVLSTNGSGTLSWINPPSNDLILTHTSGDIAPVTKTVVYRTVTTSLSGASRVWILQNLGADNQATSASDATEASAGWYWQFNRKQGYKHDGATLTPSWTITSISENSDWTSGEDPCTLLLGTGWRLPTSTEWDNADTAGGWASQSDMYNSCLRLHSAGYIVDTTGALASRGADAGFNSSTQNTTTTSWNMDMWTQDIFSANKAVGVNVRCLK